MWSVDRFCVKTENHQETTWAEHGLQEASCKAEAKQLKPSQVKPSPRALEGEFRCVFGFNWNFLEVALMPYNALALSPKARTAIEHRKDSSYWTTCWYCIMLHRYHNSVFRCLQEGMAAFVPRSKNVATILQAPRAGEWVTSPYDDIWRYRFGIWSINW